VIAIGALGLLIGWLIEISTNYRSFSFSIGFSLNMLDRWVLFFELGASLALAEFNYYNMVHM
jgi:hypothetical protein